MVGNEMGQVSLEDFKAKVKWDKIRSFANLWVKKKCPITDTPINFPCKVTARKNRQTKVMPSLYEYLNVEEGDILPGGETVLQVIPIDPESRWGTLHAFFFPLIVGYEANDAALIDQWLSCIELEGKLSRIEIPNFIRDPEENPGKNVYEAHDLVDRLLSSDAPEILEVLFKHGLSVNTKCFTDDNNLAQSLLAKMVERQQTACVRLLLKLGAATDEMEALIAETMRMGDHDTMQVLLDHQPMPDAISEEWNMLIYDLLVSNEPEDIQCASLLRDYGVFEKPVRSGTSKDLNQVQIALIDEDLSGLCKLIRLGLEVKQLAKGVDYTHNSGDIESQSMQYYVNKPQLLDALYQDDVAVFAQWVQSADFFPALRVPITAGLGPELANMCDMDADSSLNLLSFVLLNKAHSIAEYIFANFNKSTLKNYLAEKPMGAHICAVLSKDIILMVRLLESFNDIFAAESRQLSSILSDMLVESISQGLTTSFALIFGKMKYCHWQLQPPKAQDRKIDPDFISIDMLSEPFLNLLNSDGFKDCQAHWWEDAASNVVLRAMYENKRFIVQHFIEAPWYDAGEFMPVMQGKKGRHRFSLIPYISVDMFEYLLRQGLDAVALIEVMDKNSRIYRSSILREIIVCDRVDLLTHLIQNYDLSSYRFNSKNKKQALQKEADSCGLSSTIVDYQMQLSDAVLLSLQSKKLDCFEALFEAGLVPCSTDNEKISLLTKAIFNNAGEVIKYIGHKINIAQNPTLCIEGQTIPIIRLAILGLVSHDILDYWCEQGVSLEQIGSKRSKFSEHPLVQLTGVLAKKMLALSDDNGPLKTELLRMMRYILSKANVPSIEIHKCLLILSNLKPYDDIWPQAVVPVNTLISHLNENHKKLDDKFIIKGGYKGDAEGWRLIKGELDCFQKKAKAVPKKSRPKQRRFNVRPKKIVPKPKTAKKLIATANPAPVAKSASKTEAVDKTKPSTNPITATKVGLAAPKIMLKASDDAHNPPKRMIHTQPKAIKQVDLEKKHQEKAWELVEVKQKSVLSELESLEQRIAKLEIRASKRADLIAAKDSLESEINLRMGLITEQANGFELLKVDVETLDYGNAASPGSLNQIRTKLQPHFESIDKDNDSLAQDAKMLADFLNKIKATQSALKIETRDFRVRLLEQVDSIKRAVKDTQAEMKATRAAFESQYPDAKSELASETSNLARSIINNVNNISRSIKQFEPLADQPNWQAFCQKFKGLQCELVQSQLQDNLNDWQALFDSLHVQFGKLSLEPSQVSTEDNLPNMSTELALRPVVISNLCQQTTDKEQSRQVKVTKLSYDSHPSVEVLNTTKTTTPKKPLLTLFSDLNADKRHQAAGPYHETMIMRMQSLIRATGLRFGRLHQQASGRYPSRTQDLNALKAELLSSHIELSFLPGYETFEAIQSEVKAFPNIKQKIYSNYLIETAKTLAALSALDCQSPDSLKTLTQLKRPPSQGPSLRLKPKHNT